MDGPISLEDDSDPARYAEKLLKEEREKREKKHKAADARAVEPNSAPLSSSSRSHLDNLRNPPTMPTSTTHYQFEQRDRVALESLTEKSPYKSMKAKKSKGDAPAPTTRWDEKTDAEGSEEIPSPDFNQLKHEKTAFGWADAKRASSAATHNGTNGSSVVRSTSDPSSPSNPVWSDEDILMLFPHLRYVKPSLNAEVTAALESSSSSASTSSVSSSPSSPSSSLTLASPEQVEIALADIRKRYPEWMKLHLSTTWIKVRKWRELLGATREETDAAKNVEGQTDEAAESTSSSASSSSSSSTSTPPLPAGFPSNALHPRFYQSDIFFNEHDVGVMLLKERDLLYLSIENVVVPRLRILRTHLPGVNLTSVLKKNPGLLLVDLQVVLPIKLAELRTVFPEINLTALIEKDATILNHAVSSYLLPRLNLFADVTKYSPDHVVQCIVVEYPQTLTRRWNRFKRIEIVREEQFWTWYNQTHNQSTPSIADSTPSEPVADSVDTSASATLTTTDRWGVAKTVGDPSSLPFSLYANLILWSQEEFQAHFPWFELKYTDAERILFERQSKKKSSVAGSSSRTGTGSVAPTSLASLAPSVLSRVPGHPQPLSSALGISHTSQLTGDEARAARRMEYLKLKELKKEKREAQRAFMREREQDHQRRKMDEYTQKFQAMRAKGGLSLAHLNDDDSTSTSSLRSHSSSSSARNRGRGEGLTHQKNRAGHELVTRHAAHPQGRVESTPGNDSTSSSSSSSRSSSQQFHRRQDWSPPPRVERPKFGSSILESINKSRNQPTSTTSAPAAGNGSGSRW